MSFQKETWFGYVIDDLITTCVNLSKERCEGCQLNLSSAILHTHEQATLLEKIENFLSEARSNLLGYQLEGLFQKFSRYHKEAKLKAIRENLLQEIRTIISVATPQSLYFGRWITVERDNIFKDMIKKRKHAKVKEEATVPSYTKPSTEHRTPVNPISVSKPADLSVEKTVKKEQTFEHLLWEWANEDSR